MIWTLPLPAWLSSCRLSPHLKGLQSHLQHSPQPLMPRGTEAKRARTEADRPRPAFCAGRVFVLFRRQQSQRPRWWDWTEIALAADIASHCKQRKYRESWASALLRHPNQAANSFELGGCVSMPWGLPLSPVLQPPPLVQLPPMSLKPPPPMLLKLPPPCHPQFSVLREGAAAVWHRPRGLLQRGRRHAAGGCPCRLAAGPCRLGAHYCLPRVAHPKQQPAADVCPAARRAPGDP